MNPLLTLNVDQANYYLRSGRATREQAQQFCQCWNETKVSTGCHLSGATIDGISYPIIVCLPLPSDED